MLKSKKELDKLEPDSPDIFKPGMIDRYVKRPESMERVCLADFIGLYTFKGKGQSYNEEGEGNEDNNPIEADDDAAPDIANEDETDPTSRGKANKIKLEDGELTPRKNRKVIRFCRFDIRKDAKEFFRERLMLFKPWRNEQEELEQANVEEIFNQNKDSITSNAMNYIKIDIDIDEIVQQMIELRESEETETWDQEADPEFVNEYEPNENVPEPNILFDNGQEATVQVEAKKYCLPDMVSDKDYLDLCDSLNVKQRDYLMHMINSFKSGNEPLYHFVTGGAGTGKSTLIKAMYQSLIRHYRKDAGPAGKPEVLLVAPTGKAAHNIGGITAHHAFNLRFGTDNKSEKFTPPAAEKLNTMRTDLASLKVVIIDEISMMGYSTLQKIHLTLNVVYKNNNENRMFGGRSVIVLGDFNQLQPVMDNFCFLSSEKNPLNIIAGNPVWQKFKMFELTQIMRQQEDTAFAQALNRLAVGCSTDEDMEMFNKHVYTEENLPEEGKTAVRLAWSNKDVSDYNDLRVRQLRTADTRYTVSKAIDVLPHNITRQEKAQMLRNLKEKSAAETQGLQEMLLLQIGIHYMISSNIDVTDGLFNGAIGILRHYETSRTTNTVTRVFLDFGSSVGKEARNKQQANPSYDPVWTPLVPAKISFAVTKKYHNQVRRYCPLIFF